MDLQHVRKVWIVWGCIRLGEGSEGVESYSVEGERSRSPRFRTSISSEEKGECQLGSRSGKVRWKLYIGLKLGTMVRQSLVMIESGPTNGGLIRGVRQDLCHSYVYKERY